MESGSRQVKANKTIFAALSGTAREQVERLSRRFRLSFQQHTLLINIACDLHAWGCGDDLERLSFRSFGEKVNSAEQRRQIWRALQELHGQQQKKLPNYQRPAPPAPPKPNPRKVTRDQPGRLLGRCPVASAKTRCCNLLTIDAVQRCGFGCSYCAVQHFYNEGEITFPANFRQRLDALALEQSKWYHIGTGQSSDSLLWGNEEGILDALTAFARRYPRVLLEFKTKSARIEDLQRRHSRGELPANLFVTWSLAPQALIEHEERLTASLDARLLAARRLADLGCKVGFHFHPIVRFRGWEQEYWQLAARLQRLFSADEVVTVSLGTLTFAKSLLQQIRRSNYHSQILRLPLVETAGKMSYPYEIKRELMASVYQAFAGWHQRVFFYLCMEDPSLWQEVFGFEYPDNDSLEQAMLAAYRRKIYQPAQLAALLNQEKKEHSC